MSGDDVPSLPPDVVDLVASARRIEGPPGEVRDRLRARLIAPVPPPVPPGHAEPSAAVRAASGWARAPWWAVAAALVVGAGVGRLSAPPSVAPVAATPITAPAPSPERSIPRGPASADPILPPSASVGALPNVAASARSVARASSDLAAERRLLDEARAALGRGNDAEALAACDEHQRRFPRGTLAEERDALAVRALADAKRTAEARARAEHFRADYPKSILLPAVLGAAELHP